MVVAAVLCVVLSACQVTADVLVDVDEDGSGQVVVTVRLDAEAARRLGDPATALRTEDLVAAGWTLEAPDVAGDGAVVIRAVRGFASPQDLPAVLDEVGGADGVFRDVSLGVADGFASTDYSFDAQVELTGSPEQFGDDALTAALGGLPLARTPEELALEGGSDPDAMTLRVSVDLPGGDPGTDGRVEDGVATWSFPVTGGEPTSAPIASTSTVDQPVPRGLLVAASALLVAALGLGAFGLVRRRA